MIFIIGFAFIVVGWLMDEGWPGRPLSPEDELDPVVEAEEVWAWQADARAALAQPSTEGGE